MEGKPIKVLLIEDNPGDARLLQEMLAEAKGTAFGLECADRLSAGLERAARGDIDVILADLSLPDSRGLATFAQVYAQAPQVPVIVLSGLADEELAVKAVRAGAQDYLVKGQVNSNLLARAIHYAIERKQSETMQAYYLQTEHMLRQISSRFMDIESLEQAIHETLRDIGSVLHTEQVYLFKIYDDATMSRTHAWTAGVARSQNETPQKMDITSFSWTTDKLRANEVIAVSDTSQLPSPERELHERQGFLSALIVPVFIRGDLYGFLGLAETKQHRQWQNEEIGFLRNAAEIFGRAFERAQAEAFLQQRTLELATLNAVAQALSASLELKELLDEALSRTVYALGFSGGLIYLSDECTDEMTLHSYIGLAMPVVERMNSQRLDGALCDFICQQGKPLALKDLGDAAPVDVSGLLEAGLRSYVGVPIVHKERILGTLCLFDVTPHAISSNDCALLTAIGQEIGVAVENARLFEAVEAARLELQQRAEALQQANVRLQELDRLKSQFLANMSHELRTPLNSIIGFSEVLLDDLIGEMPANQKECVRDILSSGEHLLALINDVLDLSKIEAGRMTLEPMAFNVAEWLKEIQATITPLVKKKSQALSVEIADDLPPLTADRFRIKQVLLNLLSNANKFTPEGGRITLSCRLADPVTVLFSIADTGIGIKAQDQEIIFQEFRRADDSAVREITGTGLGLTISKRLVELHGGRIWVESEYGHGATFSLLLPLAGPRTMETETNGDAATSNRTVLVIEDDRHFSNLLAFYLRQEGYTPVQHYSGAGALERVRELKPNFVTLDISLPEQDGWEVLRTLKSDPQTKDIPVLVVSAVAEGGLALSLGAVDHLAKPMHRSDLQSLLGRLAASEPSGRAVKVLVVDDDQEMIRLLNEILATDRYTVLQAHDGEQGLSIAHSEHPDAIILDLMMPGMSGFEMLERLRADPETANIPVTVLTAIDVTGEKRRFVETHIQGFMPKTTLTPQNLLAELRRLEALASEANKNTSKG
jgi:signal transduction histidine kinase/CheY-like chemotaxis protein